MESEDISESKEVRLERLGLRIGELEIERDQARDERFYANQALREKLKYVLSVIRSVATIHSDQVKTKPAPIAKPAPKTTRKTVQTAKKINSK